MSTIKMSVVTFYLWKCQNIALYVNTCDTEECF